MRKIEHSHRIDRVLLVGLLLLFNPLSAQNRNPTSKLYIADLEGQSEIDTGDRIEEIRAKSVHNAQGTVIETKSDSNNSMVFSNGTGVFLDPDTRMEVRRFVQEPFTPNRTDLEVEPSISQTYGYIPRGRVGICAPKMVAGSSMIYASPHAAASIRGKKVAIEVNDFETKISSVEGEVTITGDGTGTSGQTISDGQQAIIRRLPGQPPSIEIGPIPDDEIPIVDDKVTMACNARRTVYFDSVKKLSESGLRDDDAVVGDGQSPGDSATGDDEGDMLADSETGSGFGEIFLDEPAGDDSEFEIIAVVVTPVDPPLEVIASPARITTSE
jgi:hypothetical protein